MTPWKALQLMIYVMAGIMLANGIMYYVAVEYPQAYAELAMQQLDDTDIVSQITVLHWKVGVAITTLVIGYVLFGVVLFYDMIAGVINRGTRRDG